MGVIEGCVVVLSVACAAGAIALTLRIKSQLAAAVRILEDMRGTGGNRRILAAPGQLTAPLMYEVNEVIGGYEAQLVELRKSKEASHRLMTSLSHDVRTPLTTLIGYLDAVHAGIVSNGEAQTYVETARQKAHDLKDRIDALFDWSRLSSGELTLQMGPVDVVGLTLEAVADWVPLWEEQDIAYELDMPDHAIVATLDREGYVRILNNLIQNAVSHGRANKIGISVSEQDQFLRLSVADDGVGIAERDLEHVFDRLYRCDEGRGGRGSGLGLAIVRQLATMMGGVASATSALGKGATFTLSFPCAHQSGGGDQLGVGSPKMQA